MQSSASRIETPLRRLLRAGALVAVVALLGTRAEATPLGTTTSPTPDLSALFVTVDYVASMDTFDASSTLLSLDDGISSYSVTGGALSLSATIDGTGTLSPGGTLTVTGTIAGLGFNSGTILTGTLTALGFPDTGAQANVLEFLFTVTGGDAAGLYGSTGYVALSSPGFDYQTGFTGDFSTSSGGPLDIQSAVVPEPAGLSGLVLIGLGLGLRRRR